MNQGRIPAWWLIPVAVAGVAVLAPAVNRTRAARERAEQRELDLAALLQSTHQAERLFTDLPEWAVRDLGGCVPALQDRPAEGDAAHPGAAGLAVRVSDALAIAGVGDGRAGEGLVNLTPLGMTTEGPSVPNPWAPSGRPAPNKTGNGAVTPVRRSELRIVRHRAVLTLAAVTLPQTGKFLSAWRDLDRRWTVTSIDLSPRPAAKGAPPSSPPEINLPLQAVIGLECLSIEPATTPGGSP